MVLFFTAGAIWNESRATQLNRQYEETIERMSRERFSQREAYYQSAMKGREVGDEW